MNRIDPRSLERLLAVAGCGVLLAFVLASTSARPTPTVPSRLVQRGAVLKAYRSTFSITQTQLAALSHVSATKISRLERGLDSATVAQEDAIATVLDSISRGRFDAETEAWLAAIVQRVRIRAQ
jgi:DNA-binding XRE family transcriptional regulator